MIFYENEIKRMNTWEKVVQVSNEVGFVSASVEQAKIEIAEGMAKFGLVLFQASENTHKLVNIHDTSECVEMISETREKALLELFNITIIKEAKAKVFEPAQELKQEPKPFVASTELNVTNTPQEAVARANEVRAFTPSTNFNNTNNTEYINDIHRQLHQEIGTALKYARLDGKVAPSRLGPIFNKVKVIGWNKVQFKLAVNKLLNVTNMEREMSNDQCTVLLDHLAVLEEEVNQGGLSEETKRHLDGFSDKFIQDEII